MKTVDLRTVPEKNQGWSLSGNAWWNNYLAWLASTPRNWIECRMEPPVQNPGSHLRIIYVETPEEVGILDGIYPTSGLSVWWTIICLDGAPERMQCLSSERQFSCLALAAFQSAEERFRSIITHAVESFVPKPAVYILGDWRDGEILAFVSRRSAAEFVNDVAEVCATINQAEALPWTEQFHVRAGTGRSLREAFRGLLASQRDQHGLVGRSPNESFWGSTTLHKLAG